MACRKPRFDKSFKVADSVKGTHPSIKIGVVDSITLLGCRKNNSVAVGDITCVYERTILINMSVCGEACPIVAVSEREVA